MSVKDKIKKKDKGIPKIIPAYKIIDQVQGKGYIEDYVNDLLPIIEEDIKKVVNESNKQNYSITELPTIFDIPGMDNRRAQMYIYFYLIRALKKSQYHPKIKITDSDPKKQKVFLYVKWFSQDDLDVEKYMNSFIKAHSFKTEITKKIKEETKKNKE